MLKFIFPLATAGLVVPCASQAALVISVYENAGSTYFEASGTLNLAGVNRIAVTVGDESIQSGSETVSIADLVDNGMLTASIEAQSSALFMVSDTPLPTTMYLYEGVDFPTFFGSGGAAFASQYTANGSPNFGLVGDEEFLHGILLDVDSNETFTFSQSMVFDGLTIADLGIDTGVYTWEFSNGEVITMEVPSSVIPEPTTWAALLSLGALGFTFYRRKRQ